MNQGGALAPCLRGEPDSSAVAERLASAPGFTVQQTRQLITDPHSAEARVARFLLTYGERRSARGLSPDRFELPLSRGDLANHLGLQIATISRILGRFRNRGLLDVDQRLIEILDEPAITEIAGFNSVTLVRRA